MRRKIGDIFLQSLAIPALIVTVIQFLLLTLIVNLPFNVAILDPVQDAFADLHMSDLVYSQFHPPVPADTNIVLVNVGFLPKKMIIRQLQILSAYQPRIMGVDVQFLGNPMDPEGDSLAATTLAGLPNIITWAKFWYNENSDAVDSLILNPQPFRSKTGNGYTNLTLEDNNRLRTLRSFMPAVKIGQDTALAFSLAIAQQFNSQAVHTFLKRNKQYETINYTRNMDKYYVLDVQDVLGGQADLSIVKDKIVLLGFLGMPIGDTMTLEDKFITPLNKNYAGRTFPDMFGVIVHANIISMILGGDYVDEIDQIPGFCITFFMSYGIIILFLYLFRKYARIFEFTSLLLQLILSLLLLTAQILVFYHYRLVYEVSGILLMLALAPFITNLYQGMAETFFHSSQAGIKERI